MPSLCPTGDFSAGRRPLSISGMDLSPFTPLLSTVLLRLIYGVATALRSRQGGQKVGKGRSKTGMIGDSKPTGESLAGLWLPRQERQGLGGCGKGLGGAAVQQRAAERDQGRNGRVVLAFQHAELRGRCRAEGLIRQRNRVDAAAKLHGDVAVLRRGVRAEQQAVQAHGDTRIEDAACKPVRMRGGHGPSRRASREGVRLLRQGVVVFDWSVG